MPLHISKLRPDGSESQSPSSAFSLQTLSVQLSIFAILLILGALQHFVFGKQPKADGAACALPQTDGDEGAYEETVAQIESLLVYPVKSCAGTTLEVADLGRKGFEYDRRWMVVRSRDKAKISVREDNRMVLIQPRMDISNGLLHLSAPSQRSLLPVSMPLRPSNEELQRWPLLERISMWGDEADGRVVQRAPSSEYKGTPSEWVSKFLGYEVVLVQFSPEKERDAFPIFKPPSEIEVWEEDRRKQLESRRGIEFQDEYPLLVTTRESLREVRAQIADAVSALSADPSGASGDGRGGRKIGGLDPAVWADESGEGVLRMERFRPNIVLRSLPREHDAGASPTTEHEQRYQPFSEDSWETLWIGDDARTKELGEPGASSGGSGATVHLVARCKRCLLTAVDPLSGRKDAAVPLKFLNRSRMRDAGADKVGPCFGVYGIPMLHDTGAGAGAGAGEKRSGGGERYGRLKVGDEVRVRWRPYRLDDEPERIKLRKDRAAVVDGDLAREKKEL